jgi:hypothetical protein
MSRAATTIRFYSFYLFLMGAGMVLIPNVILTILGFQPTSEIWIRMLGLFTFTTGIYYFQSSGHEQSEFFKATIFGRLFFFFATAIIVLAFHQSPMLAVVGAVDLCGAAWTWFVMRKDVNDHTDSSKQ